MKKLGHYLLLELLGGGATGTAHLARPLDPARGLPTPLVVKSVHSSLRDNESIAKRFRHEAMLCVAVDHPNVAKVYEAGSIAGTLYFSMELVQGIVVSQLLEKLSRAQKHLPVRAAVKMIRGALQGLAAVHDARHPETGEPLGIVHRDLSPNNMIAGEDGQIRLIDLGLGKSNVREWHTKTGAVLGTLGYMSPEQARGERTDRRSDLYAIGVVLWELLMLRRFFDKTDRAEMLSAMTEPTFVAPSEQRTDVPKKLDEVIRRAVAVDPEDRFQSAAEMLAAIEAAVAHLTESEESERFVADVAWAELEAARARVAMLLEESRDRELDDAEPERTVIYAQRRESSAARHEAPTQVTRVRSFDIVSQDTVDTLLKPSPVTVEVKRPRKTGAVVIGAAAGILAAVAVAAVLRSPVEPEPHAQPPAPPEPPVVRARAIEERPLPPPEPPVEIKRAIKEPAPRARTSPPPETVKPEPAPVETVPLLLAKITARAEVAKRDHPAKAAEIYQILADATLWGRSRDQDKALLELRALESKLRRLEQQP